MPLPCPPTGAETFATAEFVMLGVGARSPVRSRSPSALANWLRELRIDPASEIWRSSVSDFCVSRALRPANCASANCEASPVMSIPLPMPSELAMFEAETFIGSITALPLPD